MAGDQMNSPYFAVGHIKEEPSESYDPYHPALPKYSDCFGKPMQPPMENYQYNPHPYPQIKQESQDVYDFVDDSQHQLKVAKKRGRKKKCETMQDGYAGKPLQNYGEVVKPRKKFNRFNGMPEEEVLLRTLPDHLAPNLDIVIIGINPGLFAAYKGHHYAGPGNHFWKCLYLSGLIPEPMSAVDDHKLLKFGIGFTNIVARTSRGSADLTRTEIKEGAEILIQKLRKYNPNVAVFNGKGIYEIFCGKKDFCFGWQPDPLEGSTTTVFVMPSSSARCAQLPRAADKVPFYRALKKVRDHLKGDYPVLDPNEVIFPDVKLGFDDTKKEEKEPLPGEPNGDISQVKSEVLGGEFGDKPKRKRGRPKKKRELDDQSPSNSGAVVQSRGLYGAPQANSMPGNSQWSSYDPGQMASSPATSQSPYFMHGMPQNHYYQQANQANHQNGGQNQYYMQNGMYSGPSTSTAVDQMPAADRPSFYPNERFSNSPSTSSYYGQPGQNQMPGSYPMNCMSEAGSSENLQRNSQNYQNTQPGLDRLNSDSTQPKMEGYGMDNPQWHSNFGQENVGFAQSMVKKSPTASQSPGFSPASYSPSIPSAAFVPESNQRPAFRSEQKMFIPGGDCGQPFDATKTMPQSDSNVYSLNTKPPAVETYSPISDMKPFEDRSNCANAFNPQQDVKPFGLDLHSSRYACQKDNEATSNMNMLTTQDGSANGFIRQDSAKRFKISQDYPASDNYYYNSPMASMNQCSGEMAPSNYQNDSKPSSAGSPLDLATETNISSNQSVSLDEVSQSSVQYSENGNTNKEADNFDGSKPQSASPGTPQPELAPSEPEPEPTPELKEPIEDAPSENQEVEPVNVKIEAADENQQKETVVAHADSPMNSISSVGSNVSACMPPQQETRASPSSHSSTVAPHSPAKSPIDKPEKEAARYSETPPQTQLTNQPPFGQYPPGSRFSAFSPSTSLSSTSLSALSSYVSAWSSNANYGEPQNPVASTAATAQRRIPMDSLVAPLPGQSSPVPQHLGASSSISYSSVQGLAGTRDGFHLGLSASTSASMPSFGMAAQSSFSTNFSASRSWSTPGSLGTSLPPSQGQMSAMSPWNVYNSYPPPHGYNQNYTSATYSLPEQEISYSQHFQVKQEPRSFYGNGEY